MGLFKKKDRKGAGNDAWIAPPLLGDSTGSPYYANSAAYMGDRTDASAQPWDAPGNRPDDAASPDDPGAPGEAPPA